MSLTPEPPRDCPLCPRLVAYRQENARQNPDWWNGPAPSFGDPNARLLVAGLAPGRMGANRTGRVFTGDRSGDQLFAALDPATADALIARARERWATLTEADWTWRAELVTAVAFAPR